MFVLIITFILTGCNDKFDENNSRCENVIQNEVEIGD